MKKKSPLLEEGSWIFCAANLDENKFNVTIFRTKPRCFAKVKISGGGRCNVTHACFDPRELVKFYPRGNKELLSVFSKFQPGDTNGLVCSTKYFVEDRKWQQNFSQVIPLKPLLIVSWKSSVQNFKIKTQVVVLEINKLDNGYKIIY